MVAGRLHAGGLLRGDRGGAGRTAQGMEVPHAADVLGARLCMAVRAVQPYRVPRRSRTGLRTFRRTASTGHLRSAELRGETNRGSGAGADRAISRSCLPLRLRALLRAPWG